MPGRSLSSSHEEGSLPDHPARRHRRSRNRERVELVIWNFVRAVQLEALYESMLRPTDGRRPLAPKTVLEIHLIIRGALAVAVTKGLVNRNVAVVAHAPRLRSIPKVEPETWTAQQLQAFLAAAAGHRLFPALWVLAATGMRRSELLGLKWGDIDLDKGAIRLNRGLVSVGYELQESRGKTANARRRIELDPTTIDVLSSWRQWQSAERHAIGAAGPDWVFTDTNGESVHPDKLTQTFDRLVHRTELPVVRLHDLRHTQATSLIDADVPVKVASNASATRPQRSRSRPTSTSCPACRPAPLQRAGASRS